MSTADMNSLDGTAGKPAAVLPSGWPLWSRQVRTVIGIDLRKTLLGRRSLLIYAIASLPVIVMLFTVVVKRQVARRCSPTWPTPASPSP